MLKITILTSIPELKKNEFEELLSFVSKEKQERIKKYHFFRDAQNCLLGDILSRIEICRVTGFCNDQLRFSVNKYGKPFLSTNHYVHFNVSHAANYIACAISDEHVGIDIETIKTVDFRIAERFFTSDEITYVMACEKTIRFYEIWTKKESRIKWEGKGLYIPLNSFSVFDSSEYGKSNYHKVFQNDEAICHIYSLKNEKPSISIIDTNILMNNIAL